MEGFPAEFVTPAVQEAWEKALEKLLRSKGDISQGRTKKIRYAVLATGRKFGKLPCDVTQEDLRQFFGWLNAQGYKPWTQHDYKLFAKELFGLLKGKRFVKWIKVPTNIESPLGPEDLISRQELDRLRAVCETVQEKAMIVALDGTGFMPAEFLSLKIKNVSFDDVGAKVHLATSVKGHLLRTVRQVEDYSDLADWVLREHPVRNDPEAPLWINESTNSKNQALKYMGLCRRLKKLVKKARIENKRVYPYLFRHTRNTDWANRLPDAHLKQYAGWREDSRAPRTYIHLASDRLDETLLKSYGIIKTETKQAKRDSRENAYVAERCALTIKRSVTGAAWRSR
jgi:integrase/recombinase XerD